MALYFSNATSKNVYIALLFSEPNTSACDPPFMKMGWWNLDPQETFRAWKIDLNLVGRHAAFFAEDSEHAVWPGDGHHWYNITNEKFGPQCFTDDSNCNRVVDFVPLDFKGCSDITVTLGPSVGGMSVQSAGCGPSLVVVPPRDSLTPISYTGTGFHPAQRVKLYLNGLVLRKAPIAIGGATADSNGTFSGYYLGGCDSAQLSSPNCVVQARDYSTDALIVESNTFLIPCGNIE